MGTALSVPIKENTMSVSIQQLRSVAESRMDEAMKRIRDDKDQFIYDSLEYHLREFIEGLGEDLDK